MCRLPAHKPRQDHVRVFFRNQKTVVFQVFDFVAQSSDFVVKETFSFRSDLLSQFGLGLPNFVLALRQKLTRGVGPFCPTIASVWLEVCRSAIYLERAIGVRTVCIYVHVTLNQQRHSFGLGIGDLEDCVTIKKVVSRLQLLQAIQMPAQRRELVLV